MLTEDCRGHKEQAFHIMHITTKELLPDSCHWILPTWTYINQLALWLKMDILSLTPATICLLDSSATLTLKTKHLFAASCTAIFLHSVFWSWFLGDGFTSSSISPQTSFIYRPFTHKCTRQDENIKGLLWSRKHRCKTTDILNFIWMVTNTNGDC